jgi:hypothetical protein
MWKGKLHPDPDILWGNRSTNFLWDVVPYLVTVGEVFLVFISVTSIKAGEREGNAIHFSLYCYRKVGAILVVCFIASITGQSWSLI